MRVGDSIDDEWCVVWLLREVSEKWDCAISVRDSDGEFMLIEAADELPSWVTPSVVENRVWIYRSHLHLVPLSYVSPPSSKRRAVRFSSDDNDELAATDEFLDISDALKLVRDTSTSTGSPPQLEQTVWRRIARYPDDLQHRVHKAKAYLPVDVAKALSVNPALVQKAVEVFYTRDAVQLRAAHKMARFPPQPCLLRTVRLTRTAYAQVVGQKFYPPKLFGRLQEKEGTPEWRWKDLGMKIACGFEMVYQEGRAREEIDSDGSSTTVRAQKDALQRDPEFVKYVNSIQTAGYFRGEIEGSKLWDALESKALAVFVQSRREDDASRPSFASQVNAAIADAGGDLTPSQDPDDPDDWLTVNAEDLDRVLQDNISHNAPQTSHEMDVDPHSENEERDTTHAQVTKLKNLAKKVDAFVAGKGDVEGAMFDDEQSSGGEASDFSDGGFSEVDSDDDEDLARAARQDALEKLVPGIEPSEYGRMPSSFYDRSQRVAPVAPENEDTATEATSMSATVTETGPPRAQPRPSRAPLLPRNKYEGVDSDDDSDTDEFDGPADEDDVDDEQPELVGEVEVDMAEEEEEFLEFSRQALGITDEHWLQILQERRDRGAYVPTRIAESQHLFSETKTSDDAPEPGPRRRPRGAAAAGNPNLDSFEAVMRAMDEELARSQSKNASAGPPNPPLGEKGKGKGTAPARGADEERMDIEEVMDAELKTALEHDEDAEVDVSAEGGLDYNLIKNFLESFKSQAGLSGPVSNLVGRLQPSWGLPRDEA